MSRFSRAADRLLSGWSPQWNQARGGLAKRAFRVAMWALGVIAVLPFRQPSGLLAKVTLPISGSRPDTFASSSTNVRFR